MTLEDVGTDKEKCSKCGTIRNKADFYKDKRCKDGLRSECKKCSIEYGRKWVKTHKAKRDEYYHKWLADHKEQVREQKKFYNLLHKQQHNEYERRWIKENPEKAKAINKRRNEKKRSTFKGRLSDAISANLRNSLKRKTKSGHHWEEILGYTSERLKKHLEKYFEPWMSWNNYGRKGWEIDHVIPVSAFSFERRI